MMRLLSKCLRPTLWIASNYFWKHCSKEMITHNKNGIIVNDFEEMALSLNSYLNSSMSTIKMFNINSFKYSKRYALKKISNQWIRLLK